MFPVYISKQFAFCTWFDKVHSAFSYSCHNALVIERNLTRPSRYYWYTPPDAPFLHPPKKKMITEQLETENALSRT